MPSASSLIVLMPLLLNSSHHVLSHMNCGLCFKRIVLVCCAIKSGSSRNPKLPLSGREYMNACDLRVRMLKQNAVDCKLTVDAYIMYEKVLDGFLPSQHCQTAQKSIIVLTLDQVWKTMRAEEAHNHREELLCHRALSSRKHDSLRPTNHGVVIANLRDIMSIVILNQPALFALKGISPKLAHH